MKKSARTAIIVIVIIAVTFGLLALGGVFLRRTEELDTSAFFKEAGIEYLHKDGSALTEDEILYLYKTGDTDEKGVIRVFNPKKCNFKKIQHNFGD